MSQYIKFHLKTRNGDFYPLACFGQSNIYYEFAGDYAPFYSTEQPLTKSTLSNIRIDIREAKEKEIRWITEYKEKLQLVSSMNNSLEEKMEYINDIQEYISDLNERIEDLNNCDMFYCTLGYLLGEAEDTKYYSNEEKHLDPNDYIYFGVECSLPGQQEDEEN